MGSIIFVVLLLFIVAMIFAFSGKIPDEKPRLGVRAAGVALTIIAVITAVSACFVQIPTKEYGVVTSFGKPTGMMMNGPHLKAPWQKVTTMDATIQTDSFGGTKDCISVRIAHQATACVETSIRWRIKPGAVDSLFQNYRGDIRSVRESLVERQLSASLNGAFANYDALAIDDKGNSASGALAPIAEKAQANMVKQIGDQVDVLSVIVPVIHYDQNTQSKVNQLLAQVAETRIAEQSVKTARAQADANKTLAASVSKDPNVLVSKCLDDLGAGKFTPPAGFSCWPASSSSVVIPSASSK